MRDCVVTRVPHDGPRPAGLDIQERVMARFPGMWRAASAAGLRVFPPRSRLRRWALRREMISAHAAASRRDYGSMLVRYSPDVAMEFDPELATLGFEGTFRGHQGMLKMIEMFGEAWEQWELFPDLVIDLGNPIVGLGHFRLPGTASGLVVERELAQIVTFENGVVVHEREFLDWDRGLDAIGLDRAAIGLGR